MARDGHLLMNHCKAFSFGYLYKDGYICHGESVQGDDKGFEITTYKYNII
jgi:hypothetical protein